MTKENLKISLKTGLRYGLWIALVIFVILAIIGAASVQLAREQGVYEGWEFIVGLFIVFPLISLIIGAFVGVLIGLSFYLFPEQEGNRTEKSKKTAKNEK